MRSEKAKRANMMMNRMKSISLEEIEESEEQWYGGYNQVPQQQQQQQQQPQRLQRQPSLNSKWRLASKHLLGGGRGRGSYNIPPHPANPELHCMDSPHQASNNMVNTEPLQRQTGASEPMAFPHVNYMAISEATNPMNPHFQTSNNMAGTELSQQHQGAGEPIFYF